MKRVRSSGFTLVELLVVIAILAILAALVLPKLDGIQSGANHAVGAASANDTGRYIQIYRHTKNRLPDGWDSLIDPATGQLWSANNPGTSTAGLHIQLSGATAKLESSTLAAGEAAALNSAGIYTLYNLGTGTAGSTVLRPGDRFNVSASVTAGMPVAIVSATGGAKIIDHIYRANNRPGGVSGAVPNGKRLIAFGFGPHNQMIGRTMLEVPFYPNVDPTLVYNRNLVIFEVGTTGRAVFKAVTGADGDLLDDMSADLFKDVN